MREARWLTDEEFDAEYASNLKNHMTCRVRPTENGYECMGYHCAHCGAGTGMMGHYGYGDSRYGCRIRRLSEKES